MMEPKRRAILWVTPEVFVGFCSAGKRVLEVVANALPDDAKYIYAFYDNNREQFGIVLESETFQEIQEGEPLVWLPPVAFSDYRDWSDGCPMCGDKR